MALDEGTLRLTIELGAERVEAVHLRSTRPPQVAPLFLGKHVDEVARLVPSLFSVCRVAQGLATSTALAAAHGEPPPPPSLAMELEVLHHHAWQLAMEWPAQLGLPPDVEWMRAVLTALRGMTVTGLATLGPLFLPRLDAALAQDPRSSAPLAQFLRRCDALDAGVTWAAPRLALPSLDDVAIPLAREPDFARRPVCDGPREVGASSRVNSGGSLKSRALARVLDARRLVERLVAQELRAPVSLQPGDGTGAAMVETARGPLVHWVELDGPRVVGWRSVAPTEWTFHPDGAVQALVGTLAAEVHSRAAMYVALLDPCVTCHVDVRHA